MSARETITAGVTIVGLLAIGFMAGDFLGYRRGLHYATKQGLKAMDELAETCKKQMDDLMRARR